MRDQRQALQWVREEIGAFGGDPSAITVAGQSSGAIAISALLAGGCDLFDRAILQSGGLERVRSTVAASAVAEQFIATGAFTRGDEPGVEEILAAQRRIDSGFVPPQGPFHPCIDGDVIGEHPLVVARTREMSAIPVLAGTTRDEWRAFDAALDEEVFTEQYVRERAQALAGDGHNADAVVAAYRADQNNLRDVASAIVTDYHFSAPTEQFVRAHAERGNAVFRYELQWPSPRAGLGACHDTCLPLVFGNLHAAPALAGDDEAARHMADAVQDLWLEFVRGGEPWEPLRRCRRGDDAARPRDRGRPRAPRRATRDLGEPLSRIRVSGALANALTLSFTAAEIIVATHKGPRMADRKVFAIAVVGIGLAVGSAHPAAADDPAGGALNGVFTQYRDSAKRSTWVVVSTCDPAGNCSGHATSSRGWTALVNRVAGGPWLIERDSPDDGWVCPDGSHYCSASCRIRSTR